MGCRALGDVSCLRRELWVSLVSTTSIVFLQRERERENLKSELKRSKLNKLLSVWGGGGRSVGLFFFWENMEDKIVFLYLTKNLKQYPRA